MFCSITLLVFAVVIPFPKIIIKDRVGEHWIWNCNIKIRVKIMREGTAILLAESGPNVFENQREEP